MRAQKIKFFLYKKDGVAPPFFFCWSVRRNKILDSSAVLSTFIICIIANTNNVLETLDGRRYTYTQRVKYFAQFDFESA